MTPPASPDTPGPDTPGPDTPGPDTPGPDTDAPRLSLRAAARSHVGKVREGNEDSGLADDHVLVVADGMGGHAAGEVASASAVATFAAVPWSATLTSEVSGRVAECVGRVSEELARAVAADPERGGLGTTVTALVLSEDGVTIAHVGDSAAFLHRDGELRKLTVDHTFVQALIDAGTLTPEQARTHPRRSLLTRAVDGINDVTPDLLTEQVRPGDRLLLATDGLTGVVTAEQIAAQLGLSDPGDAADALIEAALLEGAPDNVTVIVADVIAGGEPVSGNRPVIVGAPAPPTPATASAPSHRGRLGWLIGAVAVVALIGAMLGTGWWASERVCRGAEGASALVEVFGSTPVGRALPVCPSEPGSDVPAGQ